MGVRRKQVRPARVRAHPLRDKLIAALVFVLAAGAFYYLTHLPAAVDLKLKNQHRLEAGLTDEIVMVGLARPEHFLGFEGGPSATVDVRFERARLHPDTITALGALGLNPPTGEGRIGWITRQGKGSQTFIDVRLDPASSPRTEVHAVPAGTVGHPSLGFRGEGAGFEVEMSVPLGDVGVDPGSVKQLDVQGFSRWLPGAFPIKVVVTDQAQFGLQFGANQSESSFRPGRSDGAAEDGPGLGLRALGIRQRHAGAHFDHWACAAPRGAVGWLPRGVSPGNCEAEAPLIRVTRFELGADRVKLDLSGSAFVYKDGTAISGDWYSKLENNKLIAALLGRFYAGLARWVWKVFAGE